MRSDRRRYRRICGARICADAVSAQGSGVLDVAMHQVNAWILEILSRDR